MASLTDEKLKALLVKYCGRKKSACIIGLIGYGNLGRRICKIAKDAGYEVLIHDPPKERDESEAEYDDILTQWGNGMGGCCTVREEPVVYLPFSSLARRADLLIYAVPQNAGPLIDSTVLSMLHPCANILNFSGKGILAPGIDLSMIHTTGEDD